MTLNGRPPLARSVAAVAAMLVWAGCSFEPAGLATLDNRCTSDADCSGDTCHLGMCVADQPQALSVGLEVTAPAEIFGSRPIQVTFAPTHVDGPTERSTPIVMPAPLTTVGQVPVPAEITFVREGAFLRPDATSFVTTTIAPGEEQPVAADGQPADYRVRIASDSEYAVTVRPTGEHARSHPPLYFSAVEAPRCGADAACQQGRAMWRLDIPYPDVLDEVRGRVVSQDLNGHEVAEQDLLVRAVEAESGRVVSSTAVTDEEGIFTVALSPGAGPYLLRITAGSDRPLFPGITVDPDFFFPGQDLPTILVPRLEPVRYVGFVEEDTTDAVRVPGAVLTFRSGDVFDERTRLTGSFRATAITEGLQSADPGRFDVDLLPGTYTVVVESGGGYRLGVVAQQVRITSPAEGDTLRGQIFRLPSQARFGGRVLTSGGEQDVEGVDGLPVLARALQWEPVGDVPVSALYNRNSDAMTDATGRFELHLDVGTYDLYIKPAPESGFPWVVDPAITIGSPERVLADTFEFSAPTPLSGRIEAADGTPLAGAELKAYALVPREGGGSRAVVVAAGRTDTTGRYRLLLPPRL